MHTHRKPETCTASETHLVHAALGAPGAGCLRPPPHRHTRAHFTYCMGQDAFGNQLGKLITIHNITLRENTKHCPINKHLQENSSKAGNCLHQKTNRARRENHINLVCLCKINTNYKNIYVNCLPFTPNYHAAQLCILLRVCWINYAVHFI